MANNHDEKTDAKIIAELMKEVADNRKMYLEYASDLIAEEYGLTSSALEDILSIRSSDIEKIKDNDAEMISKSSLFMLNHLYSSACDTASSDEVSENVMTVSKTTSEEIATDTNRLYEIMHRVKEMNLELVKFDYQTQKIQEDTEDILEDYYHFLSSDEVRNARKERLEIMENTIEAEGNPDEKVKLQRSLDTIKRSISMSFLFDRLETVGKKEIKSIMDAFFDENKGKFVFTKWNVKAAQYQLKPDMYQHFFNIEENYLPEEYHVYNNLFLFVVMRYIAYSDPYRKNDALYVNSVLGNICSLVYHRFSTVEDEREFVEVIKRVDDYFTEYEATFTLRNTTAPNNPVRIENDKKRDEKRRKLIEEKLASLGITDYDHDMKTDDLYEFLSKRIADMTEDAYHETEENVVVETDDDGTVMISPNLDADTDDKSVDADVDSETTEVITSTAVNQSQNVLVRNEDGEIVSMSASEVLAGLEVVDEDGEPLDVDVVADNTDEDDEDIDVDVDVF